MVISKYCDLFNVHDMIKFIPIYSTTHDSLTVKINLPSIYVICIVGANKYIITPIK